MGVDGGLKGGVSLPFVELSRAHGQASYVSGHAML
jgi:hypothetical protein